MGKMVVLGSAYSIPDEEHENTHLLAVGNTHTILVDCVGNPLIRLRRAQVNLEQFADLILTHFHPDHVSGVPLLLMDLWLLGRREPFNIYGLSHTLDRVESTLKLYELETWPNFFPLVFHRLPGNEMDLVIDYSEIRILASPVLHLIPTIGLRFEFKLNQKTVAYSCDTEPCDAVVRLAKEVNLLLHEASGASHGHSSAVQAGAIAQRARAQALALIHYPTINQDKEQLVREACQEYTGPVCLAKDLMAFDME
jgi:ribonuclease Z